jgi:hypothetical protein
VYAIRVVVLDGIGNRLIESSVDESQLGDSIECRERLGGLQQFYRRAA